MTKSKWKVDLNGYAGDIIFVLLFVLFAAFYYDSFLTKGPFTNRRKYKSLPHNRHRLRKEMGSFDLVFLRNQAQT